MRRLVILVVLVAAGACSSSSSGHKLPDWAGWAAYQHAATAPNVSLAEIDRIDRAHAPDCHDLAGAEGAFALRDAKGIEVDWFFTCGESFARKAIEGSDADAQPRRDALADLDHLAKVYGKH